MTCQRNWLYLESIFSAPDIQRQLPAEAKMFLTVDKSWKEVMRKVHRLPNALRAATQPGWYDNCSWYLEEPYCLLVRFGVILVCIILNIIFVLIVLSKTWQPALCESLCFFQLHAYSS